MTKTNYLLCRGDDCPLRMTCNRHQQWHNSDDDEGSEMEPDYRDGECIFYEQRDYYGG